MDWLKGLASLTAVIAVVVFVFVYQPYSHFSDFLEYNSNNGLSKSTVAFVLLGGFFLVLDFLKSLIRYQGEEYDPVFPWIMMALSKLIIVVLVGITLYGMKIGMLLS